MYRQLGNKLFYIGTLLGIGMIALAIFFPSASPRASKSSPERQLASLPVSAQEQTPLSRLKAKYKRPEKIPFPSRNPFTEEKYELGKMLFFDPRLSKSETMSCATCHNPSFDWSNGLPKAVGHGHKVLSRRSPVLLNLAWGLHFFWDGRAATLEEQALGPIENEKEMNLKISELVERLSDIPEYVFRFSNVFPDEGIQGETIAKAIATFERKIVSGDAPFDRWIAGDESAISESAKRGFELFNGRGRCVVCHTGWKFTNDSFADIGLDTDDIGRGNILTDHDSDFAFKTPTLRNVMNRGPYMHDGSLKSIEDILENYSQGGKIKRTGSRRFLKPLNFTRQEKDDLTAFLYTLSSEDEIPSPPRLPMGTLTSKGTQQ